MISFSASFIIPFVNVLTRWRHLLAMKYSLTVTKSANFFVINSKLAADNASRGVQITVAEIPTMNLHEKCFYEGRGECVVLWEWPFTMVCAWLEKYKIFELKVGAKLLHLQLQWTNIYQKKVYISYETKILTIHYLFF